MEQIAPPGLYGKLPAHGDFVIRNLPTSFVNEWDQWLQQLMTGTRERIGEEWLNIYLTSPLWRFALSPGVIDGSVWAGILMPSVDRVGRYFPFSIVLRLPGATNPLEFISSRSEWFGEMEGLALSALHGQITLDELCEGMAACKTSAGLGYRRTPHAKGAKALHVEMEFEEQRPFSVYPQLLDYCLTDTLGGYSVWSSDGSERVAPSLFTTQHLPAMERMAAMLDGRWGHWGYHQPYQL